MSGTVDKKPLRFKFSGHQTFAFRYGWLEKGTRAVADDPCVFSQEDALVRLGVGKNMVESIRHWCLVTQMVQEDSAAARPAGKLYPSEIARHLLLEGGWDPFLEDDASLWLVHWLLVSNPSIVTTWRLVFSTFHRTDASKREIADFVAGFAEKHGARVNERSLLRDIDCFLRTYASVRKLDRQVPIEESFDCPLQELNLLQPFPDGDLYRFSIGPKSSLPTAVFGFALAQYFERVKGGRNSMTVQECLYGPGSPGQAFKLDENSVVDYVEDLGRLTHGKMMLDETAGLKQIFRRQRIDHFELLADYYTPELRP